MCVVSKNLCILDLDITQSLGEARSTCSKKDKMAMIGVSCPSAVVNGLVQGDVRSATHIELAAKAVVVGNVYYNLIEMVMGSEVNGNLMHIGSNHVDTKRLTADKRKLPYDKKSVEQD